LPNAIKRSSELSPSITDGSWIAILREAAIDVAKAAWALLPSAGTRCAGTGDHPTQDLQNIGASGDNSVVITIDHDDDNGAEVFHDAQRLAIIHLDIVHLFKKH